MQTISPSDLLRQKRLQLITNASHVQESTTGFVHRLAITLPIKVTAINNTKFTQTSSQKNFSTGRTISTITHRKL